MTVRLTDTPLVEQQRLERYINWARVIGAVLTQVLGNVYPTLGAPYLAATTIALFAYPFVSTRLFQNARDERSLRRANAISFLFDLSIASWAMLVLSPDPAWSIPIIAILVVITSAFRFGSLGAAIAAAWLAVAYVVLAAYRASAFDYPLRPEEVALHVGIFGLAALLMSGIVRELRALRSEREDTLRAMTEAANVRAREGAQRELLAALSHDVARPLAVIQAALDLLERELSRALTPRQRDLSDAARRNVLELEQFARDLRDVAALSEGRVRLAPAPIDPRPILREIVADHDAVAQRNEQVLVLDIDAAPAEARADPQRLRQLVGNVLADAIGVSPPGAVIDLAARTAGGAFEIVVRHRAAGARPAPVLEGEGVRLAIATKLAAMHGGTLAREETIDGGVVTIRLPLRA